MAKNLEIEVNIPGICNKKFSIDDIKILVHNKGFDFKEQTKDDNILEYLYLIYTEDLDKNKDIKISSLENMKEGTYIDPANALPTFQLKAFEDVERGLNTKIEWSEYINLIYVDKKE